MNIESTNLNQTKEVKTSQNANVVNQQNTVQFADELKDCKKETSISEVTELDKNKESSSINKIEESTNNLQNINVTDKDDKNIIQKAPNIEEKDLLIEKNFKSAIENMNSIVKEFNQTEEKSDSLIKNEESSTDSIDMINKDYSIQDKTELLPQMNPNMNFSGDGQPFSSFMNNAEQEEYSKSKVALETSAQDLLEEAAILSTMSENIAIANKNQLLKENNNTNAEKITIKPNITNNDKETFNKENVLIEKNITIEKKDVATNTTIEAIKSSIAVKHDAIIMNQADVEVFVELVEKGNIDLETINSKTAEKSVQISKTLSDMLAKSIEKNQPLRIDFDNNISVIIKISRDGKITADFLPSSQVAEA